MTGSIRRPPKVDSNGNKHPDHVGTPTCDGVADARVADIAELHAAYVRVQGKYVTDFGQLDEPRKNMIKYADKTAAGLVETIYTALGSQQLFEAAKIDDDLAQLKAERCKEISAECPSDYRSPKSDSTSFPHASQPGRFRRANSSR
jgi:hypothetical protein